MALRTDEERVAHLLRRFGLGASEAEVAFYGKNGWRAAVDLLLDFDRDEGFPFTIDDFALANNAVNIRVAQIAWTARLILTRTPVREKLTLFWHDHFAVSGQKVTAGPVMSQHIDRMRQLCLGSFKDLLRDVSKDPAMIFWLDNQLNKKGKPNENFARELFELFTLGEGERYTEKDIQEAARAFSGWGYRMGRQRTENEPRRIAQFLFEPSLHDDGVKTVLGKTGPWNGDDVIDIVCDLPETAQHLTKKIWEWFVYPSPTDATLAPFAKKFQDSGLNIKVLVREIMLSEEFYSARAENKMYKSPIDFAIATVRQLGLGALMRDRMVASREEAASVRRQGLAPAAACQTVTEAMGMEIMMPPDVAGWTGGKAWISTATMVERIKWGAGLWNGAEATRARTSLRLPAAEFLPTGVSPQQFTQALLSIFDAALPPAKVKTIEDALRTEFGGTIPAARTGDAAITASRLIFGAPEFQLM